MLFEPVARQLDDALERAGLFEEMGCARNDDELCWRSQTGLSLPIQLDHDIVALADDEERRGADLFERAARQIRPTATRHDRANLSRPIGGGDERGGRTGARAKQS